MPRRRDDGKIVSLKDAAAKKAAKPARGLPRPVMLYQDFSHLTVHVRPKGGGAPEPVEVANLPFNADGLRLFLRLAADDPDGWFRGYDGSMLRFRDVVHVADPREPELKRALEPPPTPNGRVNDLRVALECRSGNKVEVVELWNIPDDAEGRALYADLRDAHPECDVLTSDYGYVPLKATEPV